MFSFYCTKLHAEADNGFDQDNMTLPELNEQSIADFNKYHYPPAPVLSASPRVPARTTSPRAYGSLLQVPRSTLRHTLGTLCYAGLSNFFFFVPPPLTSTTVLHTPAPDFSASPRRADRSGEDKAQPLPEMEPRWPHVQ